MLHSRFSLRGRVAPVLFASFLIALPAACATNRFWRFNWWGHLTWINDWNRNRHWLDRTRNPGQYSRQHLPELSE